MSDTQYYKLTRLTREDLHLMALCLTAQIIEIRRRIDNGMAEAGAAEELQKAVSLRTRVFEAEYK